MKIPAKGNTGGDEVEVERRRDVGPIKRYYDEEEEKETY